jgi:transcriptional/translational regulatory protein YebC/TACO1
VPLTIKTVPTRIRAAFTDDADEAMLRAIDAGAEDAEVEDGELLIYTDAKQLATVRDALQAAGLVVKEAQLTFVPNQTVTIADPETARKAMNLMNALDDLDDVTNTYTNLAVNE